MTVTEMQVATHSRRLRAAALVSMIILVLVAWREDIYSGEAAFLFVPFGLPSLAILLATPRRAVLGWARICGWALLVIALWVVIASVVSPSRGSIIVAATFLALAAAQLVMIVSARRLWSALATLGRLPATVGSSGVVPALYLVVCFVVAGIAVPGLLRSRIVANEAAAVGSIHSFNEAVASYKLQHLAYPERVSALGGLVNEDLACKQPPCKKSGYRFTYTLLAPDNSGPRYTITARPVRYNDSGQKSFFADRSGVVRYTVDDRPATAADSPLPSDALR